MRLIVIIPPSPGDGVLSSRAARIEPGASTGNGSPQHHVITSTRDHSSSQDIKNHNVRVLIFGVGREVAINRGISILPTITTNRHDLPGSGWGRNRRFQF